MLCRRRRGSLQAIDDDVDCATDTAASVADADNEGTKHTVTVHEILDYLCKRHLRLVRQLQSLTTCQCPCPGSVILRG